MSETKPICNRDAAVPYEQADTATCPHCGHTAREHWIARTEENVAQWERQAALSAARDELVRAAVALDAAFTDHETPTDAWSMVAARKLAWADHRAAVAAYEKLEKP